MSERVIDWNKLKVSLIRDRADEELARDLMTRHHYLGDAEMRCKRLMYVAK